MRLRAPLCLAPLLLAACATTHMAVPAELRPVAALPVHGRNGFAPGRSLSFGAFRVDGVSRGAGVRRGAWGGGVSVEADGARLGRRGRERASERFRFRLREDGGPAWRTECEQAASRSRSSVPVLGEVTHGLRTSLVCTLTPEADPAVRWTLDLAGHDHVGGVLEGGDATLHVAATDRLDETRLRASDEAGFVFTLGGRPVGAVDVTGGGLVRIDPALPPDVRAALAASMAALLLRSDLEREMDR